MSARPASCPRMGRMQSSEIRQRFLDFFGVRAHRLYPSASLVPHNDPTVLLTTGGVQQFIPYFLGQERPASPRAMSAQKCFRTPDIEEVGDWHHLTFFEMLGNFSFGDYFKKEAIEWAWAFLTEELGIEPERLWITIFEGDEGDPRFLEIWNLVFNQYEQLKDKSFVPLDKTGIDTGMGLERATAAVQNVLYLYDTDLYAPIFERAREYTGVSLGDSEATDRALRIVADHARGMAFLIADGVRPGNQRREYVLRRIIRRAMLQAYARLSMRPGQLAGVAGGVVDYMGEFYGELRAAGEEISRVVTEEAARFVEIYDSGMLLLETEIGRMQGGNFPGDVAFALHDTHGFPVEVTREVLAERGISLDEAGFEAAMNLQRERARSATQGYERVVAAFRDREIRSRFVGYEREQVETTVVAVEPVPDTEGEMFVVLAENPFYATGGGQVADEGWISSERGQLVVFDSTPAGDYQVLRARVERDGFEAGDAVTASINRVRRQQIEANHTATHILHWALRAVLGQDVVQAGSYVGPDRLRFDYRYGGRVTEDDLRRIQELCLLKITENQPVRWYTTTLEEARNLGAIMLFGEKYSDLVRVVEVDGFSRELCGGTHVRGSAEVGAFKVLSNRKHGADLYRIEVITGREALYYLIGATEKAEEVSESLKVDIDRLTEAVGTLRQEVGEAREAARERTLKQGLREVGSLLESAERINGTRVVTGQVVAADVRGLREISDDLKNRLGGPSAVVLAAALDGKAVLVANLHPEVSQKVAAGDIVREVSGVLGGGGGGGATMAQAGGGNLEAIPEALAMVREILDRRLAGS